MTTRGTKYTFQPGECVLCFEPDITKARVLYDAKILESSYSRSKFGRKVPQYAIHFSGWNSSWDRTVPESFVLKNNEANRALMKRLAWTAKHIKMNKVRKRKIDDILKQHCLKPTIDSDSSDSDDDSYEDVDSEDEEEVMEDGSELEDSKTEGEDNEEEEAMEEEEDGEPKPVELDFPDNLAAKLQADFDFIAQKRKLVRLPAEPNVISILEAYVKNFAVHVLCNNQDRKGVQDPLEKNIDLCKEVMDGLRLFFDFTLPCLLLYNFERAQYAKLSSNFKPMFPVSKKESPEKHPSTPPHSPRLRSAARNTGVQSPPATDVTPKVMHLSLRPIKKERAESPEIEEDTPRRMTRRSFADEVRKTRSGATTKFRPSNKGSAEKKASQNSDNERKRRDSLRSSVKHVSGGSRHGGSACRKLPLLKDRVTPPPPLSICSVISSKTSSPHATPTQKSHSKPSTPTTMDKMAGVENEVILNRVLTWKLIPDEVYKETPTPPTLVYGAHHLLRLFVKLPELLSQMNMPSYRLRPLLRHLNMVLEYLSERCDEFFPDSSYVDPTDAYCNTRAPVARR